MLQVNRSNYFIVLNADDTKVLHKYDKIPELVHMDPASTLAVLKPQN